MFGNLSGPTLLVILFIVLLLFGAPKLPALAKSLGQSMKILKKEVSGDGDEGKNDGAAQQQAAPQTPPAAPQTPPTAPPAAPTAPPAAPAAPPAAPENPEGGAPDGTQR